MEVDTETKEIISLLPFPSYLLQKNWDILAEEIFLYITEYKFKEFWKLAKHSEIPLKEKLRQLRLKDTKRTLLLTDLEVETPKKNDNNVWSSRI